MNNMKPVLVIPALTARQYPYRMNPATAIKAPAMPPMLLDAIALAPPVKTGGVAVAEPVIEGVGMPLQLEGDPIPQDMVGEGVPPGGTDILLLPLPPQPPPKPPPSFIFGPTYKADEIRIHPRK